MNFGGNEVVYDYRRSRIVILPVPYDETSTWMKGADKGPDAILEASVNLEFYDIETDSEAHKHGIFTLEPLTEKSSPEALVNSVHDKVISLLSGKKFPVLIGGNHTVTIGSVKAFAEVTENFSVLQLDAHSDLREEYEGSPFNHACTMARAREAAPVVQVGIRSMSAEELASAEKDRIFFAHNLYYDKSLYNKAVDLLSENVYITIDLDVFDPSLREKMLWGLILSNYVLHNQIKPLILLQQKLSTSCLAISLPVPNPALIKTQTHTRAVDECKRSSGGFGINPLF
jgi:agmatinase